MIAFGEKNPTLARFAVELDAQSPWPLGDARPDLGRATAEDVEAAQVAWSQRVFGEYRAVPIYAELLAALAEAEAPYAALAAVQRIIGDELRHTHLCATVVDWLGGWDALDVNLAGLRMQRWEGPASGRALEIIARELVLVESQAVWVLGAAARSTEDAAIRGVLEILLADEVRHVATGRALQAMVERLYPEEELRAAHERLSARCDDERSHLRSATFEAASDGPGRALGACWRVEDLEAVRSDFAIDWREALEERPGAAAAKA